jgi:uncharacterized membrane protein YedE/YeeE
MALSGVLFGVGLALSGMSQPEKVLGFLDIFGRWDPTLLWVMAAAVSVYAVLSRIIAKRAAPVFDAQFHFSSAREVDRPLLLGAAIFGVGWGLAGVCPGAAFASFGTAWVRASVSLAAIALGMVIAHYAQRFARARTRALREDAPLQPG